MTTVEAFLQSLDEAAVKARYPESTIRTWRSRVKRDKLSLDFMVAFLAENGYQPIQAMQWTKLENDSDLTTATKDAGLVTTELDEPGNKRSELGKKLYRVRKNMNAHLLRQWFDWCSKEYAIDFPAKTLKFTEAVFAQLTYGRYISKDHVLFALKALKQGKQMVKEFEAHVDRELQNL